MQQWEIFTGDCLEILPTIPAGSIDAVIADPPYGTTACAWDSVIPLGPMWEELKRIIKPRGAIALFAGQPFTSALIMSNAADFRHEWIWNKAKGANFGSVKFEPLKIHESIAVFADGAIRINHQLEDEVSRPFGKIQDDRSSTTHFGVFGSNVRTGIGYPRSIQKFPTPNNLTGGGYHPTQKPVDLMRYLIRTYTNAGDLVLDFTAGSGSTGVAAILEGRRFIGIELDPAYAEIARRRCREAAAQPPLFPIAETTQPAAAQPDFFTAAAD